MGAPGQPSRSSFKHFFGLFLCGLVCGTLWSLLSSTFLAAFASEDFLSLAAQGGGYGRWSGEFFFLIDLAMGIWIIWLYSVLLTRNSGSLASALMAALAFWVIKTLQSAKMGRPWPGPTRDPVDSTRLLPCCGPAGDPRSFDTFSSTLCFHKSLRVAKRIERD